MSPRSGSPGGEATPLAGQALREAIDARLDELVPETGEPADLQAAMRHSLLAPGKRIRPVMVLLGVEAAGGDPSRAMDAACALEMVHSASLILDDLPCMDDATLRRGRPACHRAFGEGTATLAAVSLLNHAFLVLSRMDTVPAAVRAELSGHLAARIGERGLVAGQALDLALSAADAPPRVADLETVAARKTGTLFQAGMDMAGAVAEAAPAVRSVLAEFAGHLGLCFQALDDIADREGTPDELGKDANRDGHRATFATVLGVPAARTVSEQFGNAAVRALEPLGRAADPLRDLVRGLLGGGDGRRGATGDPATNGDGVP